ncbi:MAG: hypothetical protein JSV19_10160 [Phycisphaerales bacterium]|nr:MAG: hypothetical protein JSV19_10160 [Phycisphaerales bacterium]
MRVTSAVSSNVLAVFLRVAVAVVGVPLQRIRLFLVIAIVRVPDDELLDARELTFH